MELRHLRVFLALAEELHFGRTAARLRVAQSAISQTLKQLESELGTELLIRTKRHVSLSPAGRQFLEHARASLLELERGGVAARRAASGEIGKLVLRFTLMSALTVLPRTVAVFKRRYPEVQIDIGAGGSSEQLEALRRGTIDIGFMSFKRSLSDLETLVVERSPLVAVLPRHHVLAGRKALELHELAPYPFVFLKQDSEPEVRSRFRQRCALAGFEPEIVLEVDQLEALLAFVAAGVGVSCVPAFVARVKFAGLTSVPLKLEVMGGISAVWNPSTLPEAGRRFLELLQHERERGARSPSSRSRPRASANKTSGYES